MEPQIASKNRQHLIKNGLETKSTKHVQNVLNLIPLDLQETRFRMELLSKITKTRGADKYQKILKNGAEMKPTSVKNRSRKSTKTKLKNRAPKIKKYSKNDLQVGPKEWLYFGGNAYWGAFGGPNRFCDEKVGPQPCQSAPKARKIS